MITEIGNFLEEPEELFVVYNPFLEVIAKNQKTMSILPRPNGILIAAACNNWGIGLNGELPWKLKRDLAYFERVTKRVLVDKEEINNKDKSDNDKIRNAVIMGRLTWESIPKKYQPLKGRLNIIISNSMKNDDNSNKGGYLIYPSLEKAIQDLEIDSQIFRIFIIGGSKIYEEAINSLSCKYILLTKIYKEFKCDRFFPQIDENVYKLVDHLELEKFVGEIVPQGKQLDGDIEYEFLMYKRIL
ncbi:hypothetical protein Glove_46g142 [Diversispora epigaea]|uniref:Dihydrofolate reductase n=1 Tax=Diversispora epigaea TaxID=1348612 RepID=A0A397JPG5_9GLOM|nr:hypothetical protein Glove_46g142 [Diversispora epigaea]